MIGLQTEWQSLVIRFGNILLLDNRVFDNFFVKYRFVVGAGIASFINIIIIFIANSEKEVDTVVPVLEEKANGAIMLY